MKNKGILLLASASAFLGSTVTGAIVPNDASINGNLVLWLEDAAANFSSGTWTDSSAAGKDVSNVTSTFDGTYTGVGRTSLNNSVTFNGNARSAVSIADNGIMGATGVNGGSGFSSLTIFSLYQVSAPAGATRPVGIGSKTMEDVTNNFDRFNLATDPAGGGTGGADATGSTLRFDDGFTEGSYDHGNGYVLRATKLDGGQVWDAFYDLNTDTLVYSISNVTNGSGSALGTSGASFVTQNDNLYLGEIGAKPNGTDTTSSTYNIVAVVVYDAALTGAQMEGVADYLAVPEPSTYALLGGLAALAGVMIRRRMR